MSSKSKTLFFLVLFDSSDVSATKAFEKIIVTGDRSNNLGVWGQSPQPPEANRGDFPVFSKR